MDWGVLTQQGEPICQFEAPQIIGNEIREERVVPERLLDLGVAQQRDHRSREAGMPDSIRRLPGIAQNRLR